MTRSDAMGPSDGPEEGHGRAPGSGYRAALTRGIQWTAAAQVSLVVLHFVVAIVLARLLVPEDFGLLAMAFAVISVVAGVQTFGTHGPLIQREALSPILIDTVFVLNLIVATIMAAGVFLSAPLFGLMYQSEAVVPLIRTVALALVLYALNGVPGALLRRRMQFGYVALSSTIGAVINAVIAITLAWRGYGVWSLVIAMLAASAIEVVVLMAAARFRPRLRFSLEALRSIAGYSANMTGVNVIGLLKKNAHSLIIGSFLGAGALGMYGMASRFARQPVDLFIEPVLGRVLFPLYSRLQNDDELTGRTMQRAVAGAGFLMFPVLAGMAAIARPFVEGVLGPKWSDAALLILLLVPVGMMRSIVSAVSGIFTARDRTRALLLYQVAAGIALTLAYLAGAQFSLVTVVALLLAVETVLGGVQFTLCARIARQPVVALLGGALAPLLASLAMAVTVALLDRVLLIRGWSDPAILLVAVPTGALLYAGMAVGFRMAALDDLISLLPDALARRLRPFTGANIGATVRSLWLRIPYSGDSPRP
jgi:PST family polysaccharide transporter